MRTLRPHLRSWVTAWLLFQAASLSALVPRDCCASHRPASGDEPACHQQAAASHCPMRTSGGTTCPMHESESRETCVLRGTCAGPLATLAVLLPSHGVPAERVSYSAALDPQGSSNPTTEDPIGNPAPPDIPPPRA